nr:immunoglobulin heavy chain junction region [Mus musculus]NSM04815.1 immunoglobulin heavy chain junction region [Mus musculus]NSM05316.1 immunoglobulin heavy chain junction region [Mus musculus]NSM05328.1 immunoglobulin heavy chain junction region [Mus musculus]NSM05657.1 immunoglobulin heavy chain junction region [Mus musculus]
CAILYDGYYWYFDVW